MRINPAMRDILKSVKNLLQVRRNCEYRLMIGKLKKAAVDGFAATENAGVSRYSDINEWRFRDAASRMPVSPKDVVVSFVLLQYNQYEFTRSAVESILRLEAPCRIDVVVVDNGSSAPGREKLEADYTSNPSIHFVSTGSNLGFARGNNYGYDYARKTLRSHFVIVANNDVTWPDAKTVSKLISFYESNHYALLGPNIEARQGDRVVYQNPMKRSLRTKREAQRALKVYKRMLDNVGKTALKPTRIVGSHRKTKRIVEGDIMLHGSAYILSPAFVLYRDRLFDERTFLYGEESLLALNAIGEGYKMAYAPHILAMHHAKASTNLDNLKDFYVRSNKWHSDGIRAYIDRIDEIIKL